MDFDAAIVEELRRFARDYESTDGDLVDILSVAAALELGATGIAHTADPRAKRLMMIYASELVDAKSSASPAAENSRSLLVQSLIRQLRAKAPGSEVSAGDNGTGA